jgi:hypothetical protein
MKTRSMASAASRSAERGSVPQVMDANAPNACFGDQLIEERFKLCGSITVPTVEVKTKAPGRTPTSTC